MTSVDMFGIGGGRRITPTTDTLQLTVGGIGRNQGVDDGDGEPRECLSLTAAFDHDVVDGRRPRSFSSPSFFERLGERLVSAEAL